MFSDIPLVLAQEGVNVASPDGTAPVATEGAGGEGGGATTAKEGQAGTPDGNGGGGLGQQGAGGAGPSNMLFIVMLGGLLLMVIFSMRSQSKEKKKRQALINSITKGTKVQTIGGIIGTVVELRDKEIVLKVDENSNTRMKFTRAAVQSVVTDEADEV